MSDSEEDSSSKDLKNERRGFSGKKVREPRAAPRKVIREDSDSSEPKIELGEKAVNQVRTKRTRGAKIETRSKSNNSKGSKDSEQSSNSEKFEEDSSGSDSSTSVDSEPLDPAPKLADLPSSGRKIRGEPQSKPSMIPSSVSLLKDAAENERSEPDLSSYSSREKNLQLPNVKLITSMDESDSIPVERGEKGVNRLTQKRGGGKAGVDDNVSGDDDDDDDDNDEEVEDDYNEEDEDEDDEDKLLHTPVGLAPPLPVLDGANSCSDRFVEEPNSRAPSLPISIVPAPADFLWELLFPWCRKKDLVSLSQVSRNLRKRVLAAKESHSVGQTTRLSVTPRVMMRFFSSHCPNLKQLDLSGLSTLTPTDMRAIPATVDSLDLSLTTAGDAFIPLLSENLRSLNLAWMVSLSDGILAKLPPNLIRLSLQGCIQFTRVVMDMLPATLEHLDLQECQGLGDNSFLSFRCSNLQTLNLSQCIRLSDAGLQNLPASLTSLNIEMCVRVTDATLQALPNGLLELRAGECERITDTGMKHLPRGLQLLDISHCAQISDVGIRFLPPDLKVLNLRGCAGVTERGIEALPPYLRELDISSYQLVSRRWCGVRVSNSDLAYLPESLTSLNLSGCPGITGMGLRYLKCKLKTLIINDISLLDVYLQLLPRTLTYLDISNCDITNSGIEFMRGMKDLRVLRLVGCNLKSHVIPLLESFPALQEVHLPSSLGYEPTLRDWPRHVNVFYQGFDVSK